jgi:hypothetical protein
MTLLVFLSHKGRVSGDGIVRWEAVKALAEGRVLTPDRYSIIQPIFALPLYFLAEMVQKVIPSEATGGSALHEKFVGRFNQLVALLILFWCFRIFCNRFCLTTVQAGWSTLFIALGTILLAHTRGFYSEPLWTFLILLSLGYMSDSRQLSSDQHKPIFQPYLILCVILSIPLNPLLAFVWAGVSLTFMVGQLLAADRPLKSPEWWRIILSGHPVSLGLGVLLGVLLMFFENYIRRGHVADFGYPGEGFTTPLYRGLMGQLIAPARGIVFFMPAWLLGFILLLRNIRSQTPSQVREFFIVSYVFSIWLVLAYSKWHAWHGAWYWGPRFLLLLSIVGGMAWVQLVKLTGRNRLIMVALSLVGLVSLMIQHVGFAINHIPLMECLEANPFADDCYWSWKYTPLASWINPSQLQQILTHRFMAVFAGSIVLMAIWTKSASKTP